MICNAGFFGLKELPSIDIDESTLEELAKQSANLGLTVPGVQKKLSLHLSDDGSSRLTLIGHPAGYILKPQTKDFEQLPEAEDLVMDIADAMGVKTMPHGLVSVNGEYAYISKRADRDGGNVFAMEDFCQINGRLTQDKYRGSYERCAAIIKKYSFIPGLDLAEFFIRLVVCFVTGNSDMHLKNFSLIERKPGSREYVLSPAYDLLPVNVVMPEDDEETALTLNGKKSNIDRRDFLALAENAGITDKAAEHMIRSVLEKSVHAKEMVGDSLLNDTYKSRMISIMDDRCGRLGASAGSK